MRFTYDQNRTAYQLKGGKHTCPSCGRHTLQLYINIESGEPINGFVGKCDRHYNCSYDLKPRDYYAEHPDELPPSKDGRVRRWQQEVLKPFAPIPKDYVIKSLLNDVDDGMCDFVDILLQMFPRDAVEKVVERYYLGRTKAGSVIFWQIDSRGMVHEGKVMKYDRFIGGRDKASWASGESYWIFSLLQARGVLPRDTSSTKCIFGEHLLRDVSSSSRIFIVESEKNAVFGSLMMPDDIWLAVGSSQDIGKVWKVKEQLSKCRSIVFIPDADAIKDWTEKVEHLRLKNAVVSVLCFGHAGGFDLADYVRNIWLENPSSFRRHSTIDKTPINEPGVFLFDGLWENMSEAFFSAILSPDAVLQWHIQVEKEGMPF